jgi:hypothetical protein
MQVNGPSMDGGGSLLQGRLTRASIQSGAFVLEARPPTLQQHSLEAIPDDEDVAAAYMQLKSTEGQFAAKTTPPYPKPEPGKFPSLGSIGVLLWDAHMEARRCITFLSISMTST